MAKARSLKKGGYVADFISPVTFLRATKKFEKFQDAKLFAAEMELALSAVKAGQHGETVTGACKVYEAHLDAKHKSRPELAVGNKIAMRLHIREYFGDRKIEHVTLQNLHEFAAHLISPCGGDVALPTAKNIMCVLRKVMRDAVSRGTLKDNPMTRYRKFETRAFLASHRREKPVALSLSEVRRLLDHSEGLEGVSLHVLILAGLRSSELTALRWRNVDFEAGGIFVLTSTRRRALKMGEESVSDGAPEDAFEYDEEDEIDGEAPKGGKTNKSSRFVEGTPELMAALAAHFKQTEWNGEDDFVLARPDGTAHDYDMLSYMLRAVQNTINGDLPSSRNRDRTVSNHIFRHTCVSLMIQAGIGMDEITRRIGHAAPWITIDHYWHFIGESFE